MSLYNCHNQASRHFSRYNPAGDYAQMECISPSPPMFYIHKVCDKRDTIHETLFSNNVFRIMLLLILIYIKTHTVHGVVVA